MPFYGGFFANIFLAFVISFVLVGFIAQFNKSSTQTFSASFMRDASKHFMILVVVLPLILILNTALIKHLTLQFWFFLENKAPLKYAKFLDFAASLQILEKEGGQWRFRLQNLQDYFAGIKLKLIHLCSRKSGTILARFIFIFIPKCSKMLRLMLSWNFAMLFNLLCLACFIES